MTDKLMCIPNNDTQNNPFFRIQLVVETFGHVFLVINQKVPKVFEKILSLGTSVINSPMSPPSLKISTGLGPCVMQSDDKKDLKG